MKGQRTAFTATEVNIADIKRFLEDIATETKEEEGEKGKKEAVPLFCVHQFNVEPGSAFKTMRNQKVIEKIKSYGAAAAEFFHPIPVI